MPRSNSVYSSITPPRRGLTSAEQTPEWIHSSSAPSASRSMVSTASPSPRRSSPSASARLRQHFLVHAVRLGVLHEEVPPVAAAQEGAVGPCYPFLPKVALQRDEAGDGGRRYRPGFHFAIRRGREVREPGARDLTQRRPRR